MDPEQKPYAMRLVTESVVPRRWESCRTPTGILKVRVGGNRAGNGEVRMGPLKDDMKDIEGG